MKRFSLVLILITLLVSGCAAEPNVLTLCSSLPLDNGNNSRAVSMSRAIQMAIDEQGTVTFAGQAYELRHVAMDDTSPDPADSGWDTAQEERNARAAIAEHDCIAYIGTYNSGAAKIAMPILNRAQMLMISPGNTYPGLTKPGSGIGDEPWIYSPLGSANRNFCRVVPSDDLQAPAAARYAARVLGVRRVFIFHDTEIYGRALADYFAETAIREGIEVVNAGGIPEGVGLSTVPEDLERRLLETNPDLVYFGGEFERMSESPQSQDSVATIYRNLREAGYEGYFMGADALADSVFLEGARVSTDDKLLATLVTLPASGLEQGQDFVSRYRQEYQPPQSEETDPFAAPSYEAARVVIHGLEAVSATLSPTDADFLPLARLELLQTVKGTQNYAGVLGTWSFDENCDTSLTDIYMYEANSGNFNFVGVIE